MSLTHESGSLIDLGIFQVLIWIGHGLPNVTLLSARVLPLSLDDPLIKVHEQHEHTEEEAE